MAKLNRRDFLKLATSLFVASTCHPTPVLANNNEEEAEEYIRFSPEVALDFANNFASSTRPELTLSASEPVQVLQEDGTLRGYAMDYHCGDTPYGYIVLDTECDGLVSQYTISEGTQGFYEQALEHSLAISPNASALSDKSTSPLLIITSPLSYGVIDQSTGEAFINGETIQMGVEACAADDSESVPQHRWWDIMIKVSDARSSWTVSNTGFGLQLYLVSESAAMAATERYACAVQALYSICASIPADSSYQTTLIPNPLSNWDDYYNLWAYTETTVEKVRDDGVILGTTQDAKIGEGFVSFCQSKGNSASFSFSRTPSYASFVSQVRSGQPSIYTVTINTASGEEGHSMAIEGYATLSNGSSTMRCLQGFNGWEDIVYINYDFGDYVSKRGTFLNYPLI